MGRKPKSGYGNTSVDQKWIEEHADELVQMEPNDEGETPYGARLQWTGRAEDEGSPWQIPPDTSRCSGIAYMRADDGTYVLDAAGRRLQRRCYGWRIKGGKVCIRHGGLLETVKKNAQLRLLEASDTVIGHLISIATDHKVAPSDRIKAINSILDRAGIRGTEDLRVSLKPWEMLLKKWISTDEDEDDEDAED